MEKWKIIAITALLALLPIYGYLQSNPGVGAINPGVVPGATPAPGVTPTPTPPPRVSKLWVGKKAPGWNIAPTDWANTPNPLKIEDLRGHVVLLEFWRAECSHCQEAAPSIEKMSEEFGQYGLRVVGLQSPVTKDGVNEFNWPAVQIKAKKLGIKYPIALDVGRKNFNMYKAEKFPTFIVIDRKGIVRYADHGFLPDRFKALMEALQNISSETAEPAKQPSGAAAMPAKP